MSASESLTVREASKRILADVRPLGLEEVPLRLAHGRVLGVDVISSVVLPPWDNAGMDGYAVRASDVEGATLDHPKRLRVVEVIAAGHLPQRVVNEGEASRIMTGAPVPSGADTVIRIEDTDRGESQVDIFDARDARRNVRPRGEDVASGEVVIRAGTVLGPAQLGVLASVGASTIRAVRAPRVAILSTGDELVDVEHFEAVHQGRSIVNSNAHTIAALVREAGGTALDLGIVPDDPTALRSAIASAQDVDLLVTTGGVSAGAFDYVRDVLLEMGAEISVRRIRMRPGAPTGFGRLREVRWLGLPGNPVSAMVTFELFGRPLLRTLGGHTHPFRRAIPVRLAEAVTITPSLTHFLRVIIEDGTNGDLPRVRMTGPQGSGLLTSMARAHALLVVPAGRDRYEAGETLGAIALGDRGTHVEQFSLEGV